MKRTAEVRYVAGETLPLTVHVLQTKQIEKMKIQTSSSKALKLCNQSVPILST